MLKFPFSPWWQVDMDGRNFNLSKARTVRLRRLAHLYMASKLLNLDNFLDILYIYIISRLKTSQFGGIKKKNCLLFFIIFKQNHRQNFVYRYSYPLKKVILTPPHPPHPNLPRVNPSCFLLDN